MRAAFHTYKHDGHTDGHLYLYSSLATKKSQTPLAQ